MLSNYNFQTKNHNFNTKNDNFPINFNFQTNKRIIFSLKITIETEKIIFLLIVISKLKIRIFKLKMVIFL